MTDCGKKLLFEKDWTFGCIAEPNTIGLIRLIMHRTDLTRAEIAALFKLPFTELIFRATAANAGDGPDSALLAKLGLTPMEAAEPMRPR